MQQNNNYNDSQGTLKANETKIGEKVQEKDNEHFTEGNKTHTHQFEGNRGNLSEEAEDKKNLTETQMLTPSKNQNETIQADDINKTHPRVSDKNETQSENSMKDPQGLQVVMSSQNDTNLDADSTNKSQKIEKGNNQVKPEDSTIDSKSKKGNFISRWWDNFKAKQFEQGMNDFRENKAKTQKCIEKYGNTSVYDVDSGKCRFSFNGEKAVGDFPR